MSIELITDNDANKIRRLIRQGKPVDSISMAHLEYWLFIRYPIKNALVLTDFEKCYLPEYPIVSVGEFYDYNMPTGKCKVFCDNNVLYHGRFLPQDRLQRDMIEMHIVADELCHKFIEECWKKVWT